MIRKLLLWWCLRGLLREAGKLGTLTLQQIDLETGHGWRCDLRAHHRHGLPRYSWASHGVDIHEAITDVIGFAKADPVKKISGTQCAPRLGGAEFDPES